MTRLPEQLSRNLSTFARGTFAWVLAVSVVSPSPLYADKDVLACERWPAANAQHTTLTQTILQNHQTSAAAKEVPSHEIYFADYAQYIRQNTAPSGAVSLEDLYQATARFTQETYGVELRLTNGGDTYDEDRPPMPPLELATASVETRQAIQWQLVTVGLTLSSLPTRFVRQYMPPTIVLGEMQSPTDSNLYAVVDHRTGTIMLNVARLTTPDRARQVLLHELGHTLPEPVGSPQDVRLPAEYVADMWALLLNPDETASQADTAYAATCLAPSLPPPYNTYFISAKNSHE